MQGNRHARLVDRSVRISNRSQGARHDVAAYGADVLRFRLRTRAQTSEIQGGLERAAVVQKNNADAKCLLMSKALLSVQSRLQKFIPSSTRTK